VAAVVAEEADTPQAGWLACALETRNAVVHREQLLRMWLNRPGRGQPGDRACPEGGNIAQRNLGQRDGELSVAVARWQLERRDSGSRVDLAVRFGGFEPDYPVPPPAEIRMHPDSAKRPALAERLRAKR
jgi:hypothetical protein